MRAPTVVVVFVDCPAALSAAAAFRSITISIVAGFRCLRGDAAAKREAAEVALLTTVEDKVALRGCI